MITHHIQNITISSGVASMPYDAHTFDQLLRVSDSAMLKVKSQGKNQLLQFS